MAARTFGNDYRSNMADSVYLCSECNGVFPTLMSIQSSTHSCFTGQHSTSLDDSDANLNESALGTVLDQINSSADQTTACVSLDQSSSTVDQSCSALYSTLESSDEDAEPSTGTNGAVYEDESTSDSTVYTGSGKRPYSASIKWKDEWACFLISLYESRQDEFRDPKKKKKGIWGKITNSLNEKFKTNFTIAQVEGKWKTMTAAYRRVVDNNNLTGRGRKTCHFFNELSNVYGFQPNVRPTVVIDNNKMQISSKTEPPLDPDDTPAAENTEIERAMALEEKEGRPTKANDRHQRKVKKQRTSDRFLHFLEEFKEDMKEQEDRRLQVYKETQKEKQEVMSELVGVLKSFKK